MLTNYYRKRLLETVFGITYNPFPSVYYFAPTTGSVTESGTGASSIGARVPVLNNKTTFGNANNGICELIKTIQGDTEYTASDVGGLGGRIETNYFALYDSLEGGNALIFSSFRTPHTIEEDSILSVPALENSFGFATDLVNDKAYPTIYGKNNIANLVFGNTPANANDILPTTFYLALSTTQPFENETGYTEPTFAGYSRIAIQNNSTNWNLNNLTISNKNTIEYEKATSSGNDVTHFMLFDEDGRMWFLGELNKKRMVDIGTKLQLNAGALMVDGTVI